MEKKKEAEIKFFEDNTSWLHRVENEMRLLGQGGHIPEVNSFNFCSWEVCEIRCGQHRVHTLQVAAPPKTFTKGLFRFKKNWFYWTHFPINKHSLDPSLWTHSLPLVPPLWECGPQTASKSKKKPALVTAQFAHPNIRCSAWTEVTKGETRWNVLYSTVVGKCPFVPDFLFRVMEKVYISHEPLVHSVNVWGGVSKPVWAISPYFQGSAHDKCPGDVH